VLGVFESGDDSIFTYGSLSAQRDSYYFSNNVLDNLYR